MWLGVSFLRNRNTVLEMVDGVLTGLSFKRLLMGMRDDCYRVLKPCDVMFVYFMQHAGKFLLAFSFNLFESAIFA